ncbi:MAG: MerR family transcriptional regulator [Coriobacteriia bacterium]|nr:MerR family transcriptional regulator [Coriobacteriia bacterium]
MDSHFRTIKEMAELAGVSTRTLRHWEDVNLIKPSRSNKGYRLYSDKDARRISYILAMKACGLPLTTIRSIYTQSESNLLAVLKNHLLALENQRSATECAYRKTKDAIKTIERMQGMSTEDSFEKLKQDAIKQNEERYGSEARKLYGDEAVDASNERLAALSKDEWDAKELLEASIKVQLRIALATDDSSSEESRELVRMHKRWIKMHWGESFKEEAYLALVQGYLADVRFVDYYDSAAGEGATEFLVDAVRKAQL